MGRKGGKKHLSALGSPKWTYSKLIKNMRSKVSQ